MKSIEMYIFEEEQKALKRKEEEDEQQKRTIAKAFLKFQSLVCESNKIMNRKKTVRFSFGLTMSSRFIGTLERLIINHLKQYGYRVEKLYVEDYQYCIVLKRIEINQIYLINFL